MARRLSALRPEQRIVALTPSQEARNELALVWGVESALHECCERAEELIAIGEKTLLEAGIVQQGELVVLMAGRLSGMGLSSSMKLHYIGENAPQ